MENKFKVEDLFDLKGLINLFNATDIKGVVAMEKKLINFLTQEQLEEIAKYEKDILNDLMNSKNSLEDLRAKYSKVADKLSSIGIDINTILGEPQEEDYEEEDYEEEDYEEEEDYDSEEEED